jgi:hypothetical protein
LAGVRWQAREEDEDRRRKINGKMLNFIAKRSSRLTIDEDTTDGLSLELTEYDTSPDADYESWLLLEPETERED